MPTQILPLRPKRIVDDRSYSFSTNPRCLFFVSGPPHASSPPVCLSSTQILPLVHPTMPDSHQTPWSNHPDAPKISRQLYIQEKGYFISDFIGSILYGMCKQPQPSRHLPTPSLSDLLIPGLLVVLFSRCITALFNPTYRRWRGIKWGLVSYTTIVFLVGTVVSGMDFNIKSDSYINNREFRDAGDVLPPGPLGYRSSIFSDVPMIVFDFMFFLNGWLANGLLVNFSFFSVLTCLS